MNSQPRAFTYDGIPVSFIGEIPPAPSRLTINPKATARDNAHQLATSLRGMIEAGELRRLPRTALTRMQLLSMALDEMPDLIDRDVDDARFRPRFGRRWWRFWA